MKNAGTYKITRQGQITLPAEARKKLGLKEGDTMDFYYTGEMVVLRKRKAPLEVFEELSSKASKRFRERKITREELQKETATVRKGR